MKTYIAALVLLLRGAAAPAQAQRRRAPAPSARQMVVPARYVGCWSDASGSSLSVTASRIRYGRGKQVRYVDVTGEADGKPYLLRLSVPGEFNFLSEIISLSLEGDEMRMTLYKSMEDYTAGKQFGQDTWYRDRCGRAAGRRKASAEQVQFGAESAIERPVELPYEVMKLLAQDKQFQRCYDDIDRRTEEPSVADWFAAAAVRLNADALPDLVVKAEHPCLFGANIVPFWVFPKVGRSRYRLLLQTSALGLTVLRTRTKGLRDIRTQSAFADEVYTGIWKFDGRNYRTLSATVGRSLR